jgi:hypothetical protein
MIDRMQGWASRSGTEDEWTLYCEIQAEGAQQNRRGRGEEEFQEVVAGRDSRENARELVEVVQELHMNQVDGIPQYAEEGEWTYGEDAPQRSDAE